MPEKIMRSCAYLLAQLFVEGTRKPQRWLFDLGIFRVCVTVEISSVLRPERSDNVTIGYAEVMGD